MLFVTVTLLDWLLKISPSLTKFGFVRSPVVVLPVMTTLSEKRLNARTAVAVGRVVLNKESASVALIGIKNNSFAIGDGIGTIFRNQFRIVYGRVAADDDVRDRERCRSSDRRANRNATGTVGRPVRVIMHVVVQDLKVVAIVGADTSSRLVVDRVVLNNEMVRGIIVVKIYPEFSIKGRIARTGTSQSLRQRVVGRITN